MKNNERFNCKKFILSSFHLLTGCKDVQRDILIILDSTNGISSQKFHSQKNFIEILLNEINETKIKLTVQVYSDESSCPTFTSHDHTKTIQSESDHDEIRNKLSFLKFELSTVEYDYNCVRSLISKTSRSFTLIFTRSQYIANDKSFSSAIDKFTSDQLLCVVFAQDGTKNVFSLDLTNSNFGSSASAISRLFCNDSLSKTTEDVSTTEKLKLSSELTSSSNFSSSSSSDFVASTSRYISNEVTSTFYVEQMTPIGTASDEVSSTILAVPSKSSLQMNDSTNVFTPTFTLPPLSKSINETLSIYPTSSASILPVFNSSKEVNSNVIDQSQNTISLSDIISSPSPSSIPSITQELSSNVSSILPTAILEASSLFVTKIESSSSINVSRSVSVNERNTRLSQKVRNLTSENNLTSITSLNVILSSKKITSELSSTSSTMVLDTNSANNNFTSNQEIKNTLLVSTAILNITLSSSLDSNNNQISDIMSSTMLSSLPTDRSDSVQPTYTEMIRNDSRGIFSKNTITSYITSPKPSMSRNESLHLFITSRINTSSSQTSMNISKSSSFNETIYHRKIVSSYIDVTPSSAKVSTLDTSSSTTFPSNESFTNKSVIITTSSLSMTSYILPSSSIMTLSSLNETQHSSTTPPLEFGTFTATIYAPNSILDSTSNNNASIMPFTSMLDKNMFNSSVNISLLISNHEVFPSENATSIIMPVTLTSSSKMLNLSLIPKSKFSSITLSSNASTKLNLTNPSIEQLQTSTISIESSSYNEQINASSSSQSTPQVNIQSSTSTSASFTLESSTINSSLVSTQQIQITNSTVELRSSLHPSSSESTSQSTIRIQPISIPFQPSSNLTATMSITQFIMSTQPMTVPNKTQQTMVFTQQISTPSQHLSTTSVFLNNSSSLSPSTTIENTTSIYIQPSSLIQSSSFISTIQQNNTSIQQQTQHIFSSSSSSEVSTISSMMTSMATESLHINFSSSSKFFIFH